MTTPEVKNIFNNKHMSMNQKMTALYMLTPSQALPPGSLPDMTELKIQIMELITSNKLVIHGLDASGIIQYSLCDG
jgi:hypothetical protein